MYLAASMPAIWPAPRHPPTIPATGVFGDVIVNNTATINTAAGDGIYVYTYGIGDLFVNDLGGNITASRRSQPSERFRCRHRCE